MLLKLNILFCLVLFLLFNTLFFTLLGPKCKNTFRRIDSRKLNMVFDADMLYSYHIYSQFNFYTSIDVYLRSQQDLWTGQLSVIFRLVTLCIGWWLSRLVKLLSTGRQNGGTAAWIVILILTQTIWSWQSALLSAARCSLTLWFCFPLWGQALISDGITLGYCCQLSTRGELFLEKKNPCVGYLTKGPTLYCIVCEKREHEGNVSLP